jgi:hypothetical protein
MKTNLLLIAAILIIATLTGCARSGNYVQPSNEIHGSLFGKPIDAIFAKDNSVESVTIHAESNGSNSTVDISIKNLNAKNNPSETAASYEGAAKLTDANSRAVNSGIETAVKAAGTIGGAAAKAAVGAP